MKIIELEAEEHPSNPEPGIYTVKDKPHVWAVAPLDYAGRECIPYQWARDFPELEGFVARFPTHWKLDDALECWFGLDYDPGATYWCRRQPPAEETT